MRRSILLCFALALLCGTAARASDDTIAAQARIGAAALRHDQAVLAGTADGRALIAAASALAADMRVARASVVAELPTSPAGRIGRSLLVQGFVALTAYAEWEIQLGRAEIDHGTAGLRASLAGDAAARRAEGTRLVRRGLSLV